MTTMTVTEARAALPEILDRVEAGEHVTITRHGQPVAVVLPPDILRSRSTAALQSATARLRERLELARQRPLAELHGLAEDDAEELIAAIRADRDGR